MRFKEQTDALEGECKLDIESIRNNERTKEILNQTRLELKSKVKQRHLLELNILGWARHLNS